MKKTKCALLAGAAMLAVAAAQPAMAQNVGSDLSQQAYSNFARDRNVSVLERPHPGYEALGLREGGFMIWPKLTSSVEYNDNIFASSTGQVADTIARITPGLEATSNWSRNMLEMHASGTFNRYLTYSSQDTDDYTVGGQGRLDVLRTFQINGGGDWAHLTEPRTSAPAQNQPFPVRYNLGSAFASASKEFNRLRILGRFDYQNFNYLNQAGNLDQDDRDRSAYVAKLRADYALSPDTAAFVQISGNIEDYRLKSSPVVNGVPLLPNFVLRDSHGFEALTGVNFDLTRLVRGEIGVGYLKQDYKNSAFQSIGGFGFRGQVEWFPTQLMTVKLTGSRSIQDAGIPGASGYLSTNVGGEVDYELLRNVIVTGTAGYGDDVYHGVDRDDTRYNAGISATYLMNRNIGLTLGYTFFRQDSRGTAGTGAFDMNRVLATLTLQY